MASLSDLDIDTDDDTSSSSLSHNESEKKVKDKLNGLCFLTDFVKEGFCGMMLDHNMSGGDGDATGDNSDSEVQLFIDELDVELDTCNVALLSRDKLLRSCKPIKLASNAIS